MTLTATVAVVPDERPTDGALPAAGRFLDALVGRLHAEYGGDRQEIQALATEVLTAFEAARVQAFVPILVEKRLRATYRAQHRLLS